MGCLCIALAGAGLQQAKLLQRNISIVCTRELLSGAQVNAMREREQQIENGTMFVAWQEYHVCLITDSDGAHKITADVMEISGSSELLLPYGAILHETDKEGCLLGQELAEKLYGSHNARGNTLYYDGKLFIVRGVLKEPANILIVENNNAQADFRRITLATENGKSKGRTAEQFIGRYGLVAEQLRYDILEEAYLLELVPGKWSDFSQLRQNLIRIKTDVGRLLTIEHSHIEELWLKKIGGTAIELFIGLALLGKLSYAKNTINRPKEKQDG